jgi:fructose-1,6-bisphosphatase I
MKNKKMFTEKFGDLIFNSEIEAIVENLAESSLWISRKLSTPNLNQEKFKLSEQINCQGEFVNDIDIYANNLFISGLRQCKSVSAVVSEENELPVNFAQSFFGSKYIVSIDPLDGSSNIGVNIPVGTIFAIFNGNNINAKTLAGDNIVAAGYMLYGTSLQLVLSDGKSTSVFVYDQANSRYILSSDSIKIPKGGKIYSVNEANYNLFDSQNQQFIDNCRSEKDMSSRYVGSFVSDFHRNLIKGGVYMYPSTKTYPNGKLRLLYECYPLAFIMKACGGKSISNNGNTLDVELEETQGVYLPIHQRVSLVIGSADMVNQFEKCHKIAHLRSA